MTNTYKLNKIQTQMILTKMVIVRKHTENTQYSHVRKHNTYVSVFFVYIIDILSLT